MSDKNMLSLRERLEELSTAKLDAMMQVELRKEVPDENSVKLILGILEEREKDFPVGMDAQTEAAWEKYQKRMDQSSAKLKRSRVWLRVCATASAAVLAVALFVVVPQRAEAVEFLKEVFSGWRNDILEFFSPDETVSEVERVFETDHPGMQMIYDTAVEMGVEDPLIPMWFEDGFAISSQKVVNTPTKIRMNFWFTSKIGEAIFNIDKLENEKTHGYCGENENATSFEREGALFDITQNNEKWVVVWRKNNIEYFLTIDCQEDTLNKILESIYVMEGK